MRIGNVDIKTNVALGPMAGVTDLPFRLLCKEQGCGLLYTEMVSAKAVLYNNKNTVKSKFKEFHIMIEFLTADTSSTASLLVTFLPMVLILVFMYIILYLPQKKQDKKDAAMRASIEVGDTVITIGGVVGRVAAINDKDDTFVLETTSDRVKIRFRRSAISSVEKLDMGNTAKDTAKKDAPAKKN